MPLRKSSKKSLLAERWILNASPVIALARVGQLELLTLLPAQIVIPHPVADELRNAPENDPARLAVENGMFRLVRTAHPPPEILAWDLGKGENSVLTYAYTHPGWISILDDNAARRCARSLYLTLSGTLSIVILARQYGLIESASQVLRALLDVDFRLDDRIIRDALAQTVGEVWVSK